MSKCIYLFYKYSIFLTCEDSIGGPSVISALKKLELSRFGREFLRH